MKNTCSKLADIAYVVMREKLISTIWYGNPDLIHEIAERAGKQYRHPITCSASVLSSIAKSDKFQYAGFIRHGGRKYNCYDLILKNA